MWPTGPAFQTPRTLSVPPAVAQQSCEQQPWAGWRCICSILSVCQCLAMQPASAGHHMLSIAWGLQQACGAG